MPSAIGSIASGIGSGISSLAGGIGSAASGLFNSPILGSALSIAGGGNPLLTLGTNLAGSLLGNIFAPDPPTFSRNTGGASGGGFLPSGVGIANPLFSTKQKITGNEIDVTSQFTPLGEKRRGTFEGLFEREAAALEGFDREQQITDQQALLKQIFDQQFQSERTALFDQLNAQGGGVLTTPGGRDVLGRFASNAATSRAQQDLAAFDRARVEEDRLKGLESSALKQLVEFENISSGQVDQAQRIGQVAAQGNQAIATQNFNTEAEKFAADSGLVSEIFKGVTSGIGDIFTGGRTPPINPAPNQSLFNPTGFGNTQGAFNAVFGGPSPFSSLRPQIIR
jgi:hypothetical protein